MCKEPVLRIDMTTSNGELLEQNIPMPERVCEFELKPNTQDMAINSLDEDYLLEETITIAQKIGQCLTMLPNDLRISNAVRIESTDILREYYKDINKILEKLSVHGDLLPENPSEDQKLQWGTVIDAKGIYDVLLECNTAIEDVNRGIKITRAYLSNGVDFLDNFDEEYDDDILFQQQYCNFGKRHKKRNRKGSSNTARKNSSNANNSMQATNYVYCSFPKDDDDFSPLDFKVSKKKKSRKRNQKKNKNCTVEDKKLKEEVQMNVDFTPIPPVEQQSMIFLELISSQENILI